MTAPLHCEKNRMYRDFVLSRLRGQPEYEHKTENLIDADEDWNTEVAVIIEPDSRLKPEQKAIIEPDFGMQNGVLEIPTRRALVKYVLQRFQIDPKKLDPKAAAQQIVVKNLDELKPWLYE
jgi:predicted DNA-binding transcriptional regulator YafY